jgi:hypothetical protein
MAFLPCTRIVFTCGTGCAAPPLVIVTVALYAVVLRSCVVRSGLTLAASRGTTSPRITADGLVAQVVKRILTNTAKRAGLGEIAASGVRSATDTGCAGVIVRLCLPLAIRASGTGRGTAPTNVASVGNCATVQGLLVVSSSKTFCTFGAASASGRTHAPFTVIALAGVILTSSTSIAFRSASAADRADASNAIVFVARLILTRWAFCAKSCATTAGRSSNTWVAAINAAGRVLSGLASRTRRCATAPGLHPNAVDTIIFVLMVVLTSGAVRTSLGASASCAAARANAALVLTFLVVVASRAIRAVLRSTTPGRPNALFACISVASKTHWIVVPCLAITASNRNAASPCCTPAALLALIARSRIVPSCLALCTRIGPPASYVGALTSLAFVSAAIVEVTRMAVSTLR